MVAGASPLVRWRGARECTDLMPSQGPLRDDIGMEDIFEWIYLGIDPPRQAKDVWYHSTP